MCIHNNLKHILKTLAIREPVFSKCIITTGHTVIKEIRAVLVSKMCIIQQVIGLMNPKNELCIGFCNVYNNKPTSLFI
jgi:hypothetical protein